MTAPGRVEAGLTSAETSAPRRDAPRHHAPRGTWRAFGHAEDLDLDMQGLERPTATTAVLAHCGPGGTDLWAQSVAERIGGLMRIYALTTDRDALELVLGCPGPDCATPLEAEVPIAALLEMAVDAAATPTMTASAGALVLRRPQGRDQAAWLAAGTADPEQLYADLVVSGDPADGDPALIAESLEDFDPLVAFGITMQCPDCGTEANVPVDLEGLALNAFAETQAALQTQVHQLALAYGWSEEAILALPPSRRRRYLDLIAGDGASA